MKALACVLVAIVFASEGCAQELRVCARVCVRATLLKLHKVLNCPVKVGHLQSSKRRLDVYGFVRSLSLIRGCCYCCCCCCDTFHVNDVFHFMSPTAAHCKRFDVARVRGEAGKNNMLLSSSVAGRRRWSQWRTHAPSAAPYEQCTPSAETSAPPPCGQRPTGPNPTGAPEKDHPSI